MTPLLVLAILSACNKDEPAADKAPAEVEVDWSCDPLVPDHCGMPFPSTFFMKEDTTTPTGWRVDLGPASLPDDIDGYQPAPTYWNEMDGWSVLGTLVVLLPGVSIDGLIGHQDLGAYSASDAKTVIIDVATGERVPHFAELDMTTDDVSRRTLLLHPVVPFEYGHRYVVGMRGLVDAAGALVEPSEGMVDLRDGKPSGDPRIDDRKDLYEEVVFPTLEADGWERGDVQLAWDFVVASEQAMTGRMVWMRDDAYDRIGADGPSYTIDRVDEDFSEAFGRVIHGTMTVPLYAEDDRPPTLLTRDADGMPYYNGDVEVPFVVAIPRSVLDDPHPAPIVQYGHGFFGEMDEVYETWVDWNEQLAIDNGWIFYGVEWTGMKQEDFGPTALMVATELETFAALPERTQQGFVEFLCSARLMTGALAIDPYLMGTDAESGETISLVDTGRHWYYGVSQGGILGGGYLALSPDIERAVFGVSGTPYTLLTTRSTHFEEFFTLFRTMYPDPADIQYWLAAMQTLWDMGDSAAYAATLTREPLEGAVAKQVLIQAGVGDAQVSTLAAHIQARAYGAALIDEPVREVWGLETEPSGWTGSALVEWDYGATEPVENVPPSEKTDAHDKPRHEAAGQLQIAHFFETGEVVNYCDGPCDPG